MTITDAEMISFVRSYDLEKMVLYFADKHPPSSRETRYEIEYFGRRYPAVADYISRNITENDNITHWSNTFKIGSDLTLIATRIIPHEYLANSIISSCDLLKFIRMFDISLEKAMINRRIFLSLQPPAKISQSPRKTRESVTFVRDIAGLISDYLTNIPANLLKFALVCRTFADVSLEKLRQLRGKNILHAPAFMARYCKWDIDMLVKIKSIALSHMNDIPDFSYYFCRHDELWGFEQCYSLVVGYINKNRYYIEAKNKRLIFEIIDIYRPYRRKFINSIIRKYSGMKCSARILYAILADYVLRVRESDTIQVLDSIVPHKKFADICFTFVG